jgi:hypothetical protein
MNATVYMLPYIAEVDLNGTAIHPFNHRMWTVRVSAFGKNTVRVLVSLELTQETVSELKPSASELAKLAVSALRTLEFCAKTFGFKVCAMPFMRTPVKVELRLHATNIVYQILNDSGDDSIEHVLSLPPNRILIGASR